MICRICFEPNRKNNPLITPCSCKGSSEFVHSKCLEKWHSIEPDKGLTCSVCKDILCTETIMETIPEYTHWNILITHPYLMFIGYNYLSLIFKIPVDQSNWTFFAFYICAIYLNFKINNPQRYIQSWKNKESYLLLISHLLTLSMHSTSPILTSFTNVILATVYVHRHIEILHNLNATAKIKFGSRVQKD
jgi:hypothetical protein